MVDFIDSASQGLLVAGLVRALRSEAAQILVVTAHTCRGALQAFIERARIRIAGKIQVRITNDSLGGVGRRLAQIARLCRAGSEGQSGNTEGGDETRDTDVLGGDHGRVSSSFSLINLLFRSGSSRA